MLFDSHAHLTSPQVTNLELLIARAQNAGVTRIVNIATDLPTLEKGLELSRTHPYIYNAAATTPHDVAKESLFSHVSQNARAGKLVAIGETGLDYYYEHSPKDLQKEHFIRYLHLALETKLPIIIHCRDAFADLFDITASEYRDAPLLLHCFTGTTEEAHRALDRNWMISFSGIITFKKSVALCDTLKEIPLDRILVETDTPYLAPQSKRGHPNEPSFLPETIAKLATLKNIPQDVAAATTYSNAMSFFNISET